MDIFKVVPCVEEVMTAVQFTGGAENASQISEWLRESDVSSVWRPESPIATEVLTIFPRGRLQYIIIGDWIVKRADGSAVKKSTHQMNYEYVRTLREA